METSPSTPEKPKSFYASFIPYAGTLIIAFAALRLYHYYDYFHVNIFNFISFGEIVTLFIESIREPVYIFLGFIMLILLRNISRSIPRNKKKAIQTENDPHEEQPPSWFGLIVPVSAALMLIIETIIFKPFANFIAIASLVLSITLFFTFIFYWFEKEIKTFIVQLFPIASLLFYIFFITYKDIAHVTSGRKYANTEIMLKDGTVLRSDSLTYYIGKTERFVFIFHEKENFTETIPTEEIIKYNLHKKTLTFFDIIPQRGGIRPENLPPNP